MDFTPNRLLIDNYDFIFLFIDIRQVVPTRPHHTDRRCPINCTPRNPSVSSDNQLSYPMVIKEPSLCHKSVKPRFYNLFCVPGSGKVENRRFH